MALAAPKRRRTRYAMPGIAMPRNVDGRALPARLFRGLVKAFAAEIGGELSATDRELVKTAAALAVRAEGIQAKIIAGEAVDGNEAIRLASESRRILASLKAKASQAKSSGATALQEFLAAKAAAAAAKDDADAECGEAEASEVGDA
jgi:hypothetical protein